MKTLQELQAELVELEAKRALCGDEADYSDYKLIFDAITAKKEEITRHERFNVQVGDGVTICLYSDRYAATVIKRTAQSITIQEDRAILISDNLDKQSYTYERDPKGEITTYRWSNARGQFRGGSDQSIRIINGRHQHHDYNF